MRARGFSLVELAVTMAVLALLLAATLPSAGVWLRNLRIRNVAMSMQDGLQQARSEAIRNNTTATFWLVTPSTGDAKVMDDSCTESSSSGAWVVTIDRGGITSPAGHCSSAVLGSTAPILANKQVVGSGAASLAVSVTPSSATSVTFDGFGRVVATSGASPLTDITVDSSPSGTDYRPLHVQISAPAGRVRLCDPQVPSTDVRACN